jgi:hypothetical protein
MLNVVDSKKSSLCLVYKVYFPARFRLLLQSASVGTSGGVTYSLATFKATVNQHPPAHHPLDARYYSVVDEPQLT